MRQWIAGLLLAGSAAFHARSGWVVGRTWSGLPMWEGPSLKRVEFIDATGCSVLVVASLGLAMAVAVWRSRSAGARALLVGLAMGIWLAGVGLGSWYSASEGYEWRVHVIRCPERCPVAHCVIEADDGRVQVVGLGVESRGIVTRVVVVVESTVGLGWLYIRPKVDLWRSELGIECGHVGSVVFVGSGNRCFACVPINEAIDGRPTGSTLGTAFARGSPFSALKDWTGECEELDVAALLSAVGEFRAEWLAGRKQGVVLGRPLEVPSDALISSAGESENPVVRTLADRVRGAGGVELYPLSNGPTDENK